MCRRKKSCRISTNAIDKFAMKNRILANLPGDYPWGGLFQYHTSLGSTNDHLKALARAGAPEGTAVMAGFQTNGHGRLGRSFHSPEGAGVYLSLLLRPQCAPTELMHLTCAAAVAMCEAVRRECGIEAGIKWTNDLVVGRRKLGGILTELGFTSGGALDYAIVGIGINCRQQSGDFPEEIRDMACSASMVSGRDVSPEQLAAAMLCSLFRMNETLLTGKEAMLRLYRDRCVTLGREVSVVRGDEIRRGRALDITAEGGLLVEYGPGEIREVSSGEVSIRGMYGYL